jgi:predicted RNase H-like HicB family nuclease
VLFATLPEAITEGNTFDEAMLQVQELLSLGFGSRI